MSRQIQNINSDTLTMTSREIATLVESRHDKVKQSIERLQIRNLVSFTPTGEKSETGRPGVVYLVNKRDSYVIVAQLCPEFTARLVDRWQELESRTQQQLPQSLPEALRLAADMAEQNQTLTQKVTHLENLFIEGMTPSQFVKGLNGVNCMEINRLLADKNWLWREGGHWRVGSYARDRYLTEQQSQITPRDAEPFVQYKPILLQKGASRLYEMYLNRGLVMKRGWNGQFTHNKALRGAA